MYFGYVYMIVKLSKCLVKMLDDNIVLYILLNCYVIDIYKNES